MFTVSATDLNRDLNRFGAAMARYVDEVGMDAKMVVAEQSRLLMEDMARLAPPKNLDKQKRAMNADIASVFHARNKVMFRGKKAGMGSKSDMVWLDAGPNHLTGVEQSLYRPKVSADAMGSIYKVRSGKMGNKYTQLGLRGKQHVQKINRVVVSKASLGRFRKTIEAKAGRLKASFCVGWSTLQQLTGKGRKPAQWVMRHVNNGTAKGKFTPALSSNNPSATITSTAPGCTKEAVIGLVRSAIASRIGKIQSDFKNGYIFKRLNRKP